MQTRVCELKCLSYLVVKQKFQVCLGEQEYQPSAMTSTIALAKDPWTSFLKVVLRYSFANNLHVRIHLTSIGITDQCRSFPTTFASRLSMLCVMQEVPGAFNLLAPDRGSWTVVSRGTSLRSCINPLGRSSLPFVANGNTTIPRSARFCFGRFC